MSRDKSKKEFEEAFRMRYGFGRLTASSNADAEQMMDCAEWAWKESRATLVVELPSVQCLKINDCDAEQARAYCQSAIEAVGLKVAP